METSELFEYVETLLSQKRITVEELANSLDWEINTLKKKLLGQEKFSVSDAERMAHVLSSSVDELCRLAPKHTAE